MLENISGVCTGHESAEQANVQSALCPAHPHKQRTLQHNCLVYWFCSMQYKPLLGCLPDIRHLNMTARRYGIFCRGHLGKPDPFIWKLHLEVQGRLEGLSLTSHLYAKDLQEKNLEPENRCVFKAVFIVLLPKTETR